MSSHHLHLSDPCIGTGRSRNRDAAMDTTDAGNDPGERTTVDHTGIEKDPAAVLEAFFNWSVCHH